MQTIRNNLAISMMLIYDLDYLIDLKKGPREDLKFQDRIDSFEKI